VVVAARPAYEPPITSTLVGGCSPPPIMNGSLELRKGTVEQDLEKERGDEALRASLNCAGSRRRIGVNISERKSGACWSFIHRLRGVQAPNSRHGKQFDQTACQHD
jgi:hypothetical protein